MTRPIRGRLPYSTLSIVAPQTTVFIPANLWNGSDNAGAWIPKSLTEEITYLYYDQNLDVGSKVQLYVLWTTESSTTTDTVTFTGKYSPITPEADAIPATSAFTALDTAFVADTVVGSKYIHRTAAGVINAASITDGDALALSLSVSANSGLDVTAGTAAKSVKVLGVEIAYTLTNL